MFLKSELIGSENWRSDLEPKVNRNAPCNPATLRLSKSLGNVILRV